MEFGNRSAWTFPLLLVAIAVASICIWTLRHLTFRINIWMLNSNKESTCIEAAKALGRKKNKRAVAALLDALEDHSYGWSRGTMGYAFCRALADIGDEVAIPRLLSLLEKAHGVELALYRLGQYRQPTPWLENLEAGLYVCSSLRALACIGDSTAIKSIIDFLIKRPKGQRHGGALHFLAKLESGDRSLLSKNEFSGSNSGRIFTRAVITLRILRATHAQMSSICDLRDNSDLCLFELAMLGYAPTLQLLRQLVKGQYKLYELQHGLHKLNDIAWACAWVGDESIFPILMEWAALGPTVPFESTQSINERAHARKLLGILGDARAIPVLEDMLRHSDFPKVIEATRWALDQLRWQTLQDRRWREGQALMIT